jgi:hypothetical protein
VQEAEQRVEGGLMRRLVQRLHQRIDVLQTDGPPLCFPEPMPDLIKAMSHVTQGAFCRSTVSGVTEAPKIGLKKSSHQSPSGSVLKVEMAVSSKGFIINKTRVYGRHGVTYLHI